MGVQVDFVIFVVMGCYGLLVVMVLFIGDIVCVEDVQVVDVDWVVDQVCVIFEDMVVVVFKVGVLGSIENILVIVEIVFDYFDVLLILDFFISVLVNQEDEDDCFIVICELLIL